MPGSRLRQARQSMVCGSSGRSAPTKLCPRPPSSSAPGRRTVIARCAAAAVPRGARSADAWPCGTVTPCGCSRRSVHVPAQLRLAAAQHGGLPAIGCRRDLDGRTPVVPDRERVAGVPEHHVDRSRPGAERAVVPLTPGPGGRSSRLTMSASNFDRPSSPPSAQPSVFPAPGLMPPGREPANPLKAARAGGDAADVRPVRAVSEPSGPATWRRPRRPDRAMSRADIGHHIHAATTIAPMSEPLWSPAFCRPTGAKQPLT